jgi:hypothetical protein
MLAAHLVYWGKAKVIDVISPRNIYIISKQADLSQYCIPNVLIFIHIFLNEIYFVIVFKTSLTRNGIQLSNPRNRL